MAFRGSIYFNATTVRPVKVCELTYCFLSHHLRSAFVAETRILRIRSSALPAKSITFYGREFDVISRGSRWNCSIGGGNRALLPTILLRGNILLGMWCPERLLAVCLGQRSLLHHHCCMPLSAIRIHHHRVSIRHDHVLGSELCQSSAPRGRFLLRVEAKVKQACGVVGFTKKNKQTMLHGKKKRTSRCLA